MHENTCKLYQAEMAKVAQVLTASAPIGREVIARLHRLDIDLLSVAALIAGFIEDDLRGRNDPLLDRAQGLHALLAHAVRVKVETVGPLAVVDPDPGSQSSG